MTIKLLHEIKNVCDIINKKYERGTHSKCLVQVYRAFVFPQTGISYSTFTRYVRIAKQYKMITEFCK